MEDGKTSGKEGSKYDLILKIGIPVVVLAWLGVSTVVYFLSQGIEDLTPGTAGDMFGAVNALFSALAFAFLIYTALMQREELKLQREELRETRKELARSAEAHQELVKISTVQLELSRKQYLKNEIAHIEFIRIEESRFPDKHALLLRVLNHPVKIIFVEVNSEKINIAKHDYWADPDQALPIFFDSSDIKVFISDFKMRVRFIGRDQWPYEQNILRVNGQLIYSDPQRAH